MKILLKFRTLIFLVVLFVSLGGWILPKYYYTHTYNKPGGKADEFPVLMWRRHPPSQANPHPNMGARPILETLGGVEEARKYNNGVSHYVPWTGPLEDMTVNNNRVVLRRLASDNGQSAFELDIGNELYTVTAAYRVENDEVYPEFTRISGPFVWGLCTHVDCGGADCRVASCTGIGAFAERVAAQREKASCIPKREKTMRKPLAALMCRLLSAVGKSSLHFAI